MCVHASSVCWFCWIIRQLQPLSVSQQLRRAMVHRDDQPGPQHHADTPITPAKRVWMLRSVWCDVNVNVDCRYHLFSLYLLWIGSPKPWQPGRTPPMPWYSTSASLTTHARLDLTLKSLLKVGFVIQYNSGTRQNHTDRSISKISQSTDTCTPMTILSTSIYTPVPSLPHYCISYLLPLLIIHPQALYIALVWTRSPRLWCGLSEMNWCRAVDIHCNLMDVCTGVHCFVE